MEKFCTKILAGKKAQVTDDFMIFARIDSLILNAGMKDAVQRAKAYIKAGADGVMIHSQMNKPDEIFDFCEHYNRLECKVPLVVAPTSYHEVSEEELIERGVNIVIYSNHLLRAAYPVMVATAKSILTHGRSLEADVNLLSVKDITNLVSRAI